MKRQYILSKTDTLKKNAQFDVENFIMNNLNSKDEIILKSINNKIIGYNEYDENIANYILNSTQKITLNTANDITKFFKLLKPLNSKYDMGMINWEFNTYVNNNIKFITCHNNVSKIYYNFIYDKYIEKIREKLVNSQVEFYYQELKEYRYNKTKEIVFIFKL
jgi:hypothetical protein